MAKNDDTCYKFPECSDCTDKSCSIYNCIHTGNKETLATEQKLQRACKKWFNKARENKKEILSLEAENTELKKEYSDNLSLKDEELMCLETEFNTFKSEAKELLEEFCSHYMYDCDATREDKTYEAFEELKEQAEAFLKEYDIREDRLCEHCDQYKSYPNGRCRICDNGSKWKRG